VSTAACAAFGVLAALVGVADTVPYVRDTLRGSTRPHRGSWLVWAVLAVVVVFSQRSDGASWSLLLAGSQSILTGYVFVLSIRRGEGGASRAELALIAFAGIGVMGWVAADAPIVATLCVIGADLAAAAMMVPKTCRDPHSETLSTYVLASIGGALTLGAVGALDLSLLLYPAYFCLLNAALALLIRSRRAALHAAADSARHDAEKLASAVPARTRKAVVEPR
jgi:hypothetical protein